LTFILDFPGSGLRPAFFYLAAMVGNGQSSDDEHWWQEGYSLGEIAPEEIKAG
jgi:hypothetical protein